MSKVNCIIVIVAVFTATLQAQPLIPYQTQQLYDLSNKITINDLKSSGNQETSYTLKSLLKISSVWHQNNTQLLEVYFTQTSVSAPSKNPQKIIKRALDKIPDRPFYISLIDGIPKNVIAHTSKDQSLLNLERGIASLLQIQYKDGPTRELDVAGQCTAFYAIKSSTRVEKTKTDCTHWDLKVHYRSEKPLAVLQTSKEHLEFDLNAEGYLVQVKSLESHSLALVAKPDVGSSVVSEFVLKHSADSSEDVTQLNFSSLDEAIESLEESYRIFYIESDVDDDISEIKHTTLKQQIALQIESLQDDQIGLESLAVTFAQLLPLARITEESEFVEILQQHKNLHNQLVDLLAAVQSIDAHNAIFEVFKIDSYSNSDIESLEKYLQSLAVATHPDRAILEDLLQRLENTKTPLNDALLKDTFVQTLASLAHNMGFQQQDTLLQQIRSYMLTELNDKCSADQDFCKTQYIRALQNLQDTTTIPTLMQLALTGEAKLSVAAMQALKAFPLTSFSEEHRKSFTHIFYQHQRKYDTSARTLALEILLSLKPTKEQLGELLNYLGSNDRHFEIKTYVIQKLRMLAEKCPRFNALLKDCLAERPKINNYHIIAQKGLTTVLTRHLSQAPSFNESLLSVQEIYKGVLKKGSVELILSAGREEYSTFKLGIFTDGLTSFVGDDDSNYGEFADVVEEEGQATAGMEISVQGQLLRPLIFFVGQSELMGHVWSGTASDPTPAFRATMLVQDHEHYVILSSGATVYMRVIGARSVDLNGKVELSIWNRNANTEIKQNSGAAVVGVMKVGFTQYATLSNEFIVTNEPKISLVANLDFYSAIKLCMQLQKPEMVLRHLNTKSLLLKGDGKPYMKKVSSTYSHKSMGSTLALNQKNNEMCNLIFSKN